jgi:hypothetical protein
MLLSMKGQLAEHLHRRQFLQSADVLDGAANVNSNNEALVRAVLCAGLYPNVAKIRCVARRGGWAPPVSRFREPYFFLRGFSLFLCHSKKMATKSGMLESGMLPSHHQMIFNTVCQQQNLHKILPFQC